MRVKLPSIEDLDTAESPEGARLWLVPSAVTGGEPEVVVTKGTHRPLKAHRRLWAHICNYETGCVGSSVLSWLESIEDALLESSARFMGSTWSNRLGSLVGHWEPKVIGYDEDGSAIEQESAGLEDVSPGTYGFDRWACLEELYYVRSNHLWEAVCDAIGADAERALGNETPDELAAAVFGQVAGDAASAGLEIRDLSSELVEAITSYREGLEA